MEIERKFLVNDIPNNLIIEDIKEIEQFYISLIPEVRARKSNNDFTLTIKSSGDLVRTEIETVIEKDQFYELLDMCKTNTIEKSRSIIKYKNHILELDIYKNLNNLKTVEVEFQSIEESKAFDKIIPSWFSTEITYIDDFKNKNLLLKGYPLEIICPKCKNSNILKLNKDKICNFCENTGYLTTNPENIEKYNNYYGL